MVFPSFSSERDFKINALVQHVQIAGRLIQEDKICIVEKGSCEAYSLLLTVRKRVAELAEFGLIAPSGGS